MYCWCLLLLLYVILVVIVYHCHRVYTQLQLNKYHIIKLLLASLSQSVRMGQLGFDWTGFHEIWYFSTFFKSFEKIQIVLKI